MTKSHAVYSDRKRTANNHAGEQKLASEEEEEVEPVCPTVTPDEPPDPEGIEPNWYAPMSILPAVLGVP